MTLELSPDYVAFRKRLDLLIGDQKPYAWAKKHGIADAFANLERRKVVPLPKTVKKMAEAVGCSYVWLLTGQGEPGLKEPSQPPNAKETETPATTPSELITDAELELLTRCLKDVETYVDDHKIGWSQEMKAQVVLMQFHKQTLKRLNERLLIDVLAGVDSYLEERDLDPAPALKAGLLGLLYARFEPEGHAAPSALKPFLQHVA